MMLLTSCSKSEPQQALLAKFEKVHRAAKSIEGATATGVTYVNFLPLLNTMATELLLVKDQLHTQKEERVFNSYRGSGGSFAFTIRVRRPVPP